MSSKYFEVMSAIKAGNYKPRSLWVGICASTDRKGHALQALFTGRGEYQLVEFLDKSELLVKVNDIEKWSRLCYNCDYPLTEKCHHENLQFVCNNCGQKYMSHFTTSKPYKI